MRETQSEGESNNGSATQQPPQALLERLKDYGQEDAFALWDELSADERSFLVKDIEVISLPSPPPPPPPLPSRSLLICLFPIHFDLKARKKMSFWNMNVAFFTGGSFRFFSRAKRCINKKNQNLLVLKFPISLFVIQFFCVLNFVDSVIKLVHFLISFAFFSRAKQCKHKKWLI